MKARLILVFMCMAALAVGCTQPAAPADKQSQARDAVLSQSEAALARRAGGGLGFTCTGSSSAIGCACMKGETSAPLSCSGLPELCRKQGEDFECSTVDGMEICSCAFMLRQANADGGEPAPKRTPS